MLGHMVLLISEETQLRRLLRVTLNHQGAQLVEAHRARDAAEVLEEHRPDLVLADLRQSEMSPSELVQRVRAHTDVPLLAVSDDVDEQQKIEVFDAGADDYIVIPFSRGELLARARAALRRSVQGRVQQQPESFRVGSLEVDFAAREVRLHGKSVHLTPTEYKLLGVLIASAGKVVTHKRLLEEVWGPTAAEHVHYLRVYMKQLRRKLELAPTFPQYLVTEPAVGYRLRLPA